jgi:hypothetical protein
VAKLAQAFRFTPKRFPVPQETFLAPSEAKPPK